MLWLACQAWQTFLVPSLWLTLHHSDSCCSIAHTSMARRRACVSTNTIQCAELNYVIAVIPNFGRHVFKPLCLIRVTSVHSDGPCPLDMPCTQLVDQSVIRQQLGTAFHLCDSSKCRAFPSSGFLLDLTIVEVQHQGTDILAQCIAFLPKRNDDCTRRQCLQLQHYMCLILLASKCTGGRRCEA